MSAPSFSSFPPSFSTFPDLDSEPSSSKAAPEVSSKSKKDRSEKNSSSRKRKKDDDPKPKKDKEKKRKHSSRSSKAYDLFEDERDVRSREREKPLEDIINPLSGIDEDKPIYYSDRKGDPLNVTYGGLHVYDVPKHFLADRKSYSG